MSNTIALRIHDFLKNYPPFSMIGKEDLLDISTKVIVQYYEPGQFVFEEGEATHPYFFVIKEGAVQLLKTATPRDTLVDECDEGDLFGLRPLLAVHHYASSAKTIENTLLYAIRISDFQTVFQNNPDVSLYLASSFAAGIRSTSGGQQKGKLVYGNNLHTSNEYDLIEIKTVTGNKLPITCTPDTPIFKAAETMTQYRVGSIVVVDENNHPIGIATDKDFRKKVVAGKVSRQMAIADIMSSPVITTKSGASIARIQITMLQHRIHHLCLTEDGTPGSKVTGVISEHDLLVVQANNPAVLVRKIRAAQSGDELRIIREKAEILLSKYLSQEVSIKFISDILSEINDAIIERAIQIAQDDLTATNLQPPTADFCWLALGSEGRKEQLLRTDQDNALVFADPVDEDIETVRKYYLAMAEHTTMILHECGFEYCPADMMASNPNWCLSLSEWTSQFSKWMEQPGRKEVMMTTIFFDYRPIYGNFDLASAMTDHIFDNIDQRELYLSHLANNALQNPPPLSFFRNFIVENDGEHRDQFDIKARAMMPLADAARVLILNAKIGQINNTFERFDQLAKLEENNRELFEQAADAYEILMRFRANQGLKNKDSGRFFKIDKLNKMERLMLRNSFKPISDLQSLLKVRFRLNLLG